MRDKVHTPTSDWSENLHQLKNFDFAKAPTLKYLGTAGSSKDFLQALIDKNSPHLPAVLPQTQAESSV